VRALVECPPEMGFSYPANAGWRLWALGKAGRPEIIVKEFRERWATMESVALNNTLQENWHATPDSGDEWSHCPVAPLYVTTMSLAGVRPLLPGFKRCEIRPQPGPLELLELTVHTVRGPIQFSSRGKLGNRELRLALPPGCEGELVVDQRESLILKPASAGASERGIQRYQLFPGRSATVQLKFT